MGSHQSSRGMNLENGWLYLTQHFHSISSDNMNIIIRKLLICCKASTQHIPVQHWWMMIVSALKTISMNKEDKEKCPQYSLNVWKVISLLWTLYVFSPFDLAHLSYIFCKTARPWNYLFIIPLPDQCPCCHDKRRKWDKFTDQGQISRLKIFIQS